MKEKGFILNSDTGDLAVKVTRDSRGLVSGGLVVGQVANQNQAILIHMYPGELKEAPQVGAGITSMLLDADKLSYKHKIREQLEADGFRVNHLELKSGDNGELNIELNAVYK